MSDAPDHLILVHLRRIDQRLERMENKIRDLNHRATQAEAGTAKLNVPYAGLQRRMDRIERRLNPHEARA